MIRLAEQFLFLDRAGKLELMDYYNENCFKLVKPSRRYRIQEKDNWCAMFVSVIAHMEGVEKFPYEVSVMEQVKIAKESGRFFTDIDKVKPNDLVIFDWNRDGWADHVGFVVRAGAGLLTSIEGNINGTVNYRTVSSGSKAIMGYIEV